MHLVKAQPRRGLALAQRPAPVNTDCAGVDLEIGGADGIGRLDQKRLRGVAGDEALADAVQVHRERGQGNERSHEKPVDEGWLQINADQDGHVRSAWFGHRDGLAVVDNDF